MENLFSNKAEFLNQEHLLSLLSKHRDSRVSIYIDFTELIIKSSSLFVKIISNGANGFFEITFSDVLLKFRPLFFLGF